MELGQEGWLKQTVDKVIGPIMAGDQRSRWGPFCRETALTGADPGGGKQTVSPLVQRDMVKV